MTNNHPQGTSPGKWSLLTIWIPSELAPPPERRRLTGAWPHQADAWTSFAVTPRAEKAAMRGFGALVLPINYVPPWNRQECLCLSQSVIVVQNAQCGTLGTGARGFEIRSVWATVSVVSWKSAQVKITRREVIEKSVKEKLFKICAIAIGNGRSQREGAPGRRRRITRVFSPSISRTSCDM